MSKKLEFRIPEPCHENWNKMLPVEQGKFCNACSKTVVDFSTMSDDEILQHFAKSKGNVCGRFMHDQLNRGMENMGQRKASPWRYAWNLLLAAVVSGTTATAQNKPTLGRVKICKPVKPEPEPNQLMGVVLTAVPYNNIQAVIVNETNNTPIPFATITITGSNTVISTDVQGRFEIPARIAVSDFTMEISSAGYDPKIIAINRGDKATERFVFSLKPRHVELDTVAIVSHPDEWKTIIAGGAFAVQRVTTFEWMRDTVLSMFMNRSVTVFPNPVNAGNYINVQFDLKKLGLYQVQLVSSAGQVIHAETINVQMKYQVKQIRIPASFTKGVYFVRVQIPGKTDLHNKKMIVK